VSSVDVPPCASRADHRDVRFAEPVVSSDNPCRTLVCTYGAHVGFTELRARVRLPGRTMTAPTFRRFLVVLRPCAEMQVARTNASGRVARMKHAEIPDGSDVTFVHHTVDELILSVEPSLTVPVRIDRPRPEPAVIGLLDLAQDALEMREVRVVPRSGKRITQSSPAFVMSAAPSASSVWSVAALNRARPRRHVRHTRTHQDTTNNSHEIRVAPCRSRIATRRTDARTAGTGPSSHH